MAHILEMYYATVPITFRVFWPHYVAFEGYGITKSISRLHQDYAVLDEMLWLLQSTLPAQKSHSRRCSENFPSSMGGSWDSEFFARACYVSLTGFWVRYLDLEIISSHEEYFGCLVALIEVRAIEDIKISGEGEEDILDC